MGFADSAGANAPETGEMFRENAHGRGSNGANAPDNDDPDIDYEEVDPTDHADWFVNFPKWESWFRQPIRHGVPFTCE